MKHVDEYRDSELCRNVAEAIRAEAAKVPRTLRFMEFCGGHTVAIARYGIDRLLPDNVKLISGPGCPVCVTDMQTIDRMIALCDIPGTIITTYGDMIRVPGSGSSLAEKRARSTADVRIVYSSYDALEIALENPDSEVIFFGIGFETTAPATAASVIRAAAEDIENFSVVSAHKTTPPIVKALLDSGEVALDGLLCPGHVSVVTGVEPYRYAAGKGVACAISGFEPLDVLQSVLMLVRQCVEGRPAMEIQYRRGVKERGNPRAREVMNKVFETSSGNWRGIGEVPDSGLVLREKYRKFDSFSKFNIPLPDSKEPAGCICGRVLRGVAEPSECGLYGKRCTPSSPVGACMVSSEGACQAHYRWKSLQ